MNKLLIILLLGLNFVNAQDNKMRTNSVFFELFGNGYSFWNLSYERVLYSSNPNNDVTTFCFTGRAGMGVGERVTDSVYSYNFPIELVAIYGRQHNIEAGIGITPCLGKEVTDTTRNPPVHFNHLENVGFLRLGYRNVTDYNIIYRVAPMIQFPSQLNWKPEFTLGLSVGYNF